MPQTVERLSILANKKGFKNTEQSHHGTTSLPFSSLPLPPPPSPSCSHSSSLLPASPLLLHAHDRDMSVTQRDMTVTQRVPPMLAWSGEKLMKENTFYGKRTHSMAREHIL